MTVTNDLTWRRLAEAEGFLTLGMPNKALAIMNARANWSSMPFEANLLAGLAHRELQDFHTAIEHLEKASKSSTLEDFSVLAKLRADDES